MFNLQTAKTRYGIFIINSITNARFGVTALRYLNVYNNLNGLITRHDSHGPSPSTRFTQTTKNKFDQIGGNPNKI